MKQIVAILTLCIGGAIVIFMIPGWLDRIQLKPETFSRPGKSFRRDLAEGVRLGRHGVYGVDFVRCGKCSLEKRRKGVLTFGGLNVLVLEDLKVVIPPAETTNANDGVEGTSAQEIASRLGVDNSFLGTRGVGFRFSGLRIVGFELAHLEGTNVVQILTASRGEAFHGGLLLRDCGMIGENRTNRVEEALLRFSPHLILEWEGGSRRID